MSTKILLSGVAPSGNLHIGNYLGAIKQWVDLQQAYRVFAMVADLHAITTSQEPRKLRAKILEVSKLFVACGIDPNRSVVFVQSHVPAHTELSWILGTITPVGELERMTQFKEKRTMTGVLAGLLNYPVLQAADILLYQAAAVPVGEDQLQHLELTRMIARKFNNRFGKALRVPQPLIIRDVARVMGLDDPIVKMSKSATSPNNYIALLDSPADVRRKIKIAVTDSGRDIRYDPDLKPAISNLMAIYRAFSELPYQRIEAKYRGKRYSEFKHDLAELIVQKLAPIQKRHQGLSDAKITSILSQGRRKAEAIAKRTLTEAKRKVGFLEPR